MEKYNVIGWQNNAPPAINAENLNKMDNQIARLTEYKSDYSESITYNGSMETLGYTKFSDCVQNGFYDCPKAYVAEIKDKPSDLNTTCICVVYDAIGISGKFRFVYDIEGGVWLRSPFTGQWFNIAHKDASIDIYRGGVPSTVGENGVTEYWLKSCTKNGHYDFKTADVQSGAIKDKPSELTKGGMCSVETSPVLGLTTQIVTDISGNIWSRVIFSTSISPWKSILKV